MDNEGIPHDDPRFVEILEACLHMEIAGHKESYRRSQGEIKRIKRNVLMKLERRKELKKKIEDAENLISTLNVTLKKLQEHVRETDKKIALIEAKADDRSKLRSYEMQRYHDILQEYEKTWQSYHARYEEFPLAKKRKGAKINVERARIQGMVLEYQIKDMERKIQGKKEMDYLRTRSRVVEFVKEMSNNEKLEKGLTDVTTEIDSCKQELRLRELELKSLREQEEKKKKVRSMQLLAMPPPKINLSRMRLNYSRKWQEQQLGTQRSEIDNDSMSVNTVTLEEMCIRDETSDKTSKKKETAKELPVPIQKIDSKRTTSFASQIDEKEKHNIKNTKTCIEATSLKKDTHGERELSFTNNAVTISKERSLTIRERDMHKATTSELSEKEKYDQENNQFSYNVQELKKMKKFIGNKQQNTDNMEFELPHYSLKLANEENTTVPRVLKIEKVQYEVTPLGKETNVVNTSKTIPSHNFQRNESSIGTSFTLNDTVMGKELNASRSTQLSMYDDNSLNFKYSDCANGSPIANMDINMDSIDSECQKVDRKENEKEEMPKASPHFNFSSITKLKNNIFSLF